MIRLWHYAELCYLMVGGLWAVEFYRCVRWREYRHMKPRDYMRSFALVAAAPVTLAYIVFSERNR